MKENYLTAANGTWHPECFVCAVSLFASDHTHGSESHTSLRINERDTHAFALFATFCPQGWWKPYAWWIRCGWNDANKSRKPYSSVWVSITFSSNPLLYAASGQKRFSVQLNFCFTPAVVQHKTFAVEMLWHEVATSTLFWVHYTVPKKWCRNIVPINPNTTYIKYTVPLYLPTKIWTTSNYN